MLVITSQSIFPHIQFFQTQLSSPSPNWTNKEHLKQEKNPQKQLGTVYHRFSELIELIFFSLKLKASIAHTTSSPPIPDICMNIHRIIR